MHNPSRPIQAWAGLLLVHHAPHTLSMRAQPAGPQGKRESALLPSVPPGLGFTSGTAVEKIGWDTALKPYRAASSRSSVELLLALFCPQWQQKGNGRHPLGVRVRGEAEGCSYLPAALNGTRLSYKRSPHRQGRGRVFHGGCEGKGCAGWWGAQDGDPGKLLPEQRQKVGRTPEHASFIPPPTFSSVPMP